MLRFSCCLVILTILIGCTKLYPLSGGDILVNDDKIYQNGRLFAELRYLGGSRSENRYNGIAIYYHQHNKEVWIFPKEGFTIIVSDENKTYSTISEIEAWSRSAKEKGYVVPMDGKYVLDSTRVWYGIGNRNVAEFKPMPFVFDVKISPDGKYIYYKEKGILFDSSKKYLIEYGISD